MEKFEKVLKELNTENLYKVLHCEVFSSAENVKKAYKKMMKVYHPDKNKERDAVKIFENVRKAYEVLEDEETKKFYDEYLTRKEDKAKRVKTFSAKRRIFVEELKKKEEEAKNLKTFPKDQDNDKDNIFKNRKREDQENFRFEEVNPNEQKKKFDKKLSTCGVKVKWSKNSDSIFTKEIINSFFKNFGQLEEIRIEESKYQASILFQNERSVDNLLLHFPNDENLSKIFKIKKCDKKEFQESPIFLDTKTLDIIKNMKFKKNIDFMNKIQSENSNNKINIKPSDTVSFELPLEELEKIAFEKLKKKVKNNI